MASLDVRCGYCESSLAMKIEGDMNGEDYEFSQFHRLLGSADCPRCNRTQNILKDEHGELVMHDADWDKTENELMAVVYELIDKLDELEEKHEGGKITHAAFETEKAKLERDQESAQQRFDAAEEKYEAKRERVAEKSLEREERAAEQAYEREQRQRKAKAAKQQRAVKKAVGLLGRLIRR